MNIIENNNIENNESFVEQRNFDTVEQGTPQVENIQENNPVLEVKEYTDTEKGLSNIPNAKPASDISSTKEEKIKTALPTITSLDFYESNDWGMVINLKQEIAETF